jgi:hypothetical protein
MYNKIHKGVLIIIIIVKKAKIYNKFKIICNLKCDFNNKIISNNI